jgi:hypothetical protein
VQGRSPFRLAQRHLTELTEPTDPTEDQVAVRSADVPARACETRVSAFRVQPENGFLNGTESIEQKSCKVVRNAVSVVHRQRDGHRSRTSLVFRPNPRGKTLT